MTTPIDNYYDRTDPTKRYDEHLFIAGQGLQSAELNEIQKTATSKIKSIGDALFKDGDIIKDCAALVDPDTGLVKMNGGALYLRGVVRGIVPATFTVPVDQSVSIGVRLTELTITELEDPTLRDPAVGTRNYQEPGAARLQVNVVWGWNGDGAPGEFYAVYTVENGTLLQKEPPPQMDTMTAALARYDRDSAGGNYVISGFSVSASFDAVAGKITTLATEGRARVNGFGVEVPRSVRLIEDMDRDVLTVLVEPETFSPAANGKMRVELDNTPVVSIHQVSVTAEKTVTLTHGAFSGAKDSLPDNAILSLIEVKQGSTTYVQGTDYKLTSGQVDWSLTGAEPAPGSSYTVKYQYQTTTATIEGIDSTGFTISGAVSGSLMTIDYDFALPRIDSIVVDAEGRVTRIKGVASQHNAAAPNVPSTQLQIATLSHSWATNPVVTQDIVAVMPMDQLQGLRTMVLDLFDLVSQEQLRNAIGLSDPAAKRGVFVDPFTNDNLRDSGVTQNAAIINGELMLPIDAVITQFGAAITAPATLNYTLETLIEQPNKTGTMTVNPYQAFDPIPATVTLTPGVDFWTVTNTVWLSSVTQTFTVGSGNRSSTTTSSAVQLVSSNTTDAQFLRSIPVTFKVTGFGPNEQLGTITFDGITVTPEAL